MFEYYPCQECLMGHYDENNCNKCKYHIALILLEEVIKENDYCNLCKNCDHIKGGYLNCKLDQERNKDCNFEIDWEHSFKEYGIDIEKLGIKL